METGTVPPLRSLKTDLARWHPVNPDAAVSLSYQYNFRPTLYISTCPRVGMILPTTSAQIPKLGIQSKKPSIFLSINIFILYNFMNNPPLPIKFYHPIYRVATYDVS